MKVPFHKIFAPPFSPELDMVTLRQPGFHRQRTRSLLKAILKTQEIYLTPSCTHAMEAIALAMNLKPGDEVIVPSFSFVTTASAFALHGAKIVFADIEPGTMNIDIAHAGRLITSRTRAMVVMHYSGVACHMEEAAKICRENDIFLIEDAAHSIGATWTDSNDKKQALGTIGDAGAWSFHHTKNVQCGEGGALHINHPTLKKRLNLILEKGTNRHDFQARKVDHYEWVTLGSSYTMSDVSAAWLEYELGFIEKITARRKFLWSRYHDALTQIQRDYFTLPNLTSIQESNGHIFYIHCRDAEMRTQLISHLDENGISAYFHYPALHLSPAGKKYGSAPLGCPNAEKWSDSLLRLPIYPDLTEVEQDGVTAQIGLFFKK